jgi:hypothetical protein
VLSFWKIILTIVVTSMMLVIMLIVYRWLSIDTNPLWLVAVVGAVPVAVLGVTHGHAIVARAKNEAGEIQIATRPFHDVKPTLGARSLTMPARARPRPDRHGSSTKPSSVARKREPDELGVATRHYARQTET